jgi:dimethylargininase
VEGGDVCDAEGHTFIGLSERTNAEGARQTADWLALQGYTASVVDIRGRTELLHLKSGLASLGDKRLAITEGLAQAPEAYSGYELVRVPSGEEYAANCVRIGSRVLVAAGHPRFEATLRELGYEVLSLEMSEFQKMDGGLSCLSLRF